MGDKIVIDISVEAHEDPVKEIGRILKERKELFQSYDLIRELEQSINQEKRVALRNLEVYLKDHEDRAYIDLWSTVADTQLELGLVEKAVKTYKKMLLISPNMIFNFKHRIKIGDLPREILD